MYSESRRLISCLVCDHHLSWHAKQCTECGDPDPFDFGKISALAKKAKELEPKLERHGGKTDGWLVSVYLGVPAGIILAFLIFVAKIQWPPLMSLVLAVPLIYFYYRILLRDRRWQIGEARKALDRLNESIASLEARTMEKTKLEEHLLRCLLDAQE